MLSSGPSGGLHDVRGGAAPPRPERDGATPSHRTCRADGLLDRHRDCMGFFALIGIGDALVDAPLPHHPACGFAPGD